MKGELVLIDNKEKETCFIIGEGTLDYSLYLRVSDELSIEEQLIDKKEINKIVKATKEFLLKSEFDCNYELEVIDYLEESYKNLFDSVEYIKLEFDYLDIKEYIKKNPFLLTKKIVLGNTLSIDDYDEIVYLKNEFSNLENNIYVELDGNQDYITLNECFKTIETIKEITDNIKRLNLSKMEEVMYVYDIVRSRVYNLEKTGENITKSRDLTKVLFGDNIVCLGYANLFKAILNYLGIKNDIVYLDYIDETKAGHALNCAYIIDPKYDIDGLYYFDATFDSKRTHDDKRYLFRYNHFAKTRSFLEEYKNRKDKRLPKYTKDIYKIVEEKIINGETTELLCFVQTINHMSLLVGEKRLLEPIDLIKNRENGTGETNEFIEEFLKKFKNICSKYDKEISGETLIELLINVRKIQYYQNEDLYPYSFGDMLYTYLISEWKLNNNYLTFEERLLARLFEEDDSSTNIKLNKINFNNYIRNNEHLLRDIEGTRLAKVLQKTLRKK